MYEEYTHDCLEETNNVGETETLDELNNNTMGPADQSDENFNETRGSVYYQNHTNNLDESVKSQDNMPSPNTQ